MVFFWVFLVNPWREALAAFRKTVRILLALAPPEVLFACLQSFLLLLDGVGSFLFDNGLDLLLGSRGLLLLEVAM